MKLKKNHYYPASLIGEYWGNPNDTNKSRYREVFKINLLDFYISLQKDSKCDLLSFIETHEGEDVCYSRIYLEDTETSLKVNKKEETFISLVRRYPSEPKIFSKKDNKLAICNYVALLTQRNPLHYNNISINQNNIYSIPNIIKENNSIILKEFPKTVKFYENFHFDIITTTSNNLLGIFLGSMTHLSTNSNIWGKTFLTKINQTIGSSSILNNSIFVLIPITTKSFLLGVKKTNFSDVKIIFCIFRNNFEKIVELWNSMQMLVSHEIVFKYNDYYKIKKSISSHPKYLNEVISEISQSLDYNINLFLDNKIFQKNICTEFSIWRNLVCNLNNKKTIPIHVSFLNKPNLKREQKKSQDLLDKLNIRIFITKHHMIDLSFIIKNTGEVYQLISNREIYYSPNFYYLFDSIIYNHPLIFEEKNQKAFLLYENIPEYNKIITYSREKYIHLFR